MFKRLVLIIISFSLIVISENGQSDIFYTDNQLAVYTFYTYSGEIFIVKQSDYNQTKKSLKGVRGISVSYQSEMESVLNSYENKKLKFSETESGIQIFYYYDKNLTDFLVVDGQKVNIHIAFNNGRVTIGYPFIFGGF